MIHPATSLKLGGIVLCGGQSRRMGRAKAWIETAGETFLQRVVRLTSEAVNHVVVAGKADQSLPPLPLNVPFVADVVADAGPLAGVAAGMDVLADRCDAVFVVACDQPLLRPAFITRLHELLENHEAVAPDHAGRRHPLTAVYRIGVLATIQNMLRSRNLRVMSLLERCRTRLVTAADFADCDPALESLRNINDDADLRALRPRE